MQPESRRKPKVTPAMLKVGERVLREWLKSDEWDYRRFLARLYRAMAKNVE
jgi:hypothetical protein